MQEQVFSPFFWFSFLLHLSLLALFETKAIFSKKPTYIAPSVRVNVLAQLPGSKPKDQNALPLMPSKPPSPPTKSSSDVPNKNSPSKEDKKTAPKAPDLEKSSKKPLKNQPANPPKNPSEGGAETKSDSQKLQEQKLQEQQSHALEKISALKQIESIQQELAEQENQQEGQIPLGEGSAHDMDIHIRDQYFSNLKAHINMYWSLPQELADQNLRAQIHTIIDPSGKVLAGSIVLSSGNEDFDARVLETIYKASPFPPPPTEEITKLLLKGLLLNFPR